MTVAARKTSILGLGIARDALIAGGSAPAALSTANEDAAAAFLERRIGLLDIGSVCTEALNGLPAQPVASLADALEADRTGRAFARQALGRQAVPA
jgi:1-deoxy-D-xylulose-5-phosphate reductoisomerase